MKLKHFSKTKSPRVFYSFLLTFYLASSVVNWLPVIDNVIVRSIKYLLFIAIFLYEMRNNRLKFPSLYLSPVGLIMVLSSMIFGLLLSFKMNTIIDIIIPFLMIWVFNFPKEFYYKALYRAAILVVGICLFSIASHFTGFYDVKPNGPWDFTFGQAAFGGYSTGYSNSLFLFVPFLVFWHRVNDRPLISIETIAIVIIIVAQYLTGGRGGLLASGIVFFMSFRIRLIYKLVFIGMLFSVVQSESFLTQMRIKGSGGYGNTIDMNTLSTGRVELSTYYFSKFKERPFFGYGFGDKDDIDNNIDVHIVWLRNTVDGGVVYLFFLIAIFVNILTLVRKNKTLDENEKKLFNALFYISFVITFLEPNYLIGSVQGEIVYWLLISLLIKKRPVVNRNWHMIKQNDEKESLLSV